MTSVPTPVEVTRRVYLASSPSVSGATSPVQVNPEGSFMIDESELSYYDFSVRDYDEYLNVSSSGDAKSSKVVVMNLDEKPTVIPPTPAAETVLSANKDPWWSGRMSDNSSTTSGYNDTESSESDISSGEEEEPSSPKPVCILVQEVNSSRYYYMTSSGEVVKPDEPKKAQANQKKNDTSQKDYPELPASETGGKSNMSTIQIEKIGAAFDALVKSTVGSLSTPRKTTAPAPPSKPASRFPCPHCDLFKNNGDPNMLRLHIYTHYTDFWKGKIDCRLRKDPRDDLVRKCTMCSRAISGGTEDGLRQAALCHFAIQHMELRKALESDSRLPEEFAKNLYQDLDRKNGGPTYYDSFAKALNSGQRKIPQGGGQSFNRHQTRSNVASYGQSRPSLPNGVKRVASEQIRAQPTKKQRIDQDTREASGTYLPADDAAEKEYIDERSKAYDKTAGKENELTE